MPGALAHADSHPTIAFSSHHSRELFAICLHMLIGWAVPQTVCVCSLALNDVLIGQRARTPLTCIGQSSWSLTPASVYLHDIAVQRPLNLIYSPERRLRRCGDGQLVLRKASPPYPALDTLYHPHLTPKARRHSFVPSRAPRDLVSHH